MSTARAIRNQRQFDAAHSMWEEPTDSDDLTRCEACNGDGCEACNFCGWFSEYGPYDAEAEARENEQMKEDFYS